MKLKDPLPLFTILALLALGGLVYVSRDYILPPAKPLIAEKVAVAPVPPPAPSVAPVPSAPPAAPVAKIIPPSFDTVRVENDGMLVVAGRTSPAAEVAVLSNGVKFASAAAMGDGSFVMNPNNPLPVGPTVLSLQATMNGTTVTADKTVAVDVKPRSGASPMVAILKADEPTRIVQAPQAPVITNDPSIKGVTIDTVDYDDKGTNVFGGHGPAGSTVQVYVDNKLHGKTSIGEQGAWTMVGAADLSVGSHVVRADEIGSDGQVKSRFEIPFYREDPSRVVSTLSPPAPAEPVKTETKVETVTAQASNSGATVTAKATITQPVKQEATPAPTAAPPTAVVPKVEGPVQPAVLPPAPEVPVTPPSPVVAQAPVQSQPTVTAEPAPAQKPAPIQAAPIAQAEPAPVAAEQPVAAASLPEEAAVDNRIVIQPGNNLWTLSRKIYGKGVKYTVIYEANKSNIRNPSLIYPGQVFVAPPAQ